jgi:hypothetical protein
MPHDIIDNLVQKLVEHSNRILKSTEPACTAIQLLSCHSPVAYASFRNPFEP